MKWFFVASTEYQLKRRIVCCDLCEGFKRSVGRHRKEALHCAPVMSQIRFKNFWLFGVVQRAQAELEAVGSLFQCNFANNFGILHPLRAAPGRDQVLVAIDFEQIDRCRVELAGLSSSDFEQIVVGRAESESNQKSKYSIEESFRRRSFPEFPIACHESYSIPLSSVVAH